MSQLSLQCYPKLTEEWRSLECNGGGFISWASMNRHRDVTIKKPVDKSSKIKIISINEKKKQFSISITQKVNRQIPKRRSMTSDQISEIIIGKNEIKLIEANFYRKAWIVAWLRRH